MVPAPVPVLAQAQNTLKKNRHVPREEAPDRNDGLLFHLTERLFRLPGVNRSVMAPSSVFVTRSVRGYSIHPLSFIRGYSIHHLSADVIIIPASATPGSRSMHTPTPAYAST